MTAPGPTLRSTRLARALLAAMAVLGVGLVLGGQPSHAYVSCTRPVTNDEEVHVQLSSSADDVKIARSASGVFEISSTAAPVPTSCGNANVIDIAVVRVFVGTSPSNTTDAGAQKVTIDMTNGAFEPGATADPNGGAREIEFDVQLGNDASGNDEVVIVGTTGADTMVFGTGAGTHQANLNATDPEPDADLFLGGIEKVTIDGKDGNDSVTGAGGADTGGEFGLPMAYVSGSGNDTFVGGAVNDTFAMGSAVDGADKIVGGSGAGDEASYSGRTSGAVRVTIDAVANDGANDGAEGDNVDVENIVGGGGNDYFEGTKLDGTAPEPTSQSANKFDGGNGTDEVSYADRTQTVVVIVADGANDGGTGENDDVTGSIETVTGGSGNDDITGEADAETLNGGGGVDELNGGGGNDTLNGDAGNDTLNGDAGNDTLNGGLGSDDLNGGTHATGDTVTYSDREVAVNLTLDGQPNDGEANENDNLVGIENLTGSPHNDTIAGDANANTLNGGDGTDTVSYSFATTAVTVNLATTTAQVTGGGGSDTLTGFENLVGSPHNDTLTGNAGNNVIEGGAGDDRLAGGLGDDTLDGEAHTTGDTVDYIAATSGVIVDLNAGTASGQGTDTIIAIENARGSNSADRLSGTSGVNALYGEKGDDILNGRAGNDILDGGYETDPSPTPPPEPDGMDSVSYADASAPVTVDLDDSTNNAGEAVGDVHTSIEGIEGSAHNDLLSGDENDNRISGLAGDDTINGRSGNDRLSGGLGDDALAASSGDDTVDYTGVGAHLVVNLTTQLAIGEGTDTLGSVEHVVGGSGNDTIVGSLLNNTLDGGAGNDTISGGLGNDSLLGGDGADVLRPEGGVDGVDGGGGTDTVDYSTAAGQITASLLTGSGGTNGDTSDTDTYAGGTIENIVGSAQVDSLTGDANANVLSGLGAADRLDGDAGNDTLIGGAGGDTLIGGGGSDTADYSTAAGLTVDLRAPANNTGDAAGDTYTTTATTTAVENLAGSPGNDTLAGDANSNVLTGGAGTDTVSYSGATVAVNVSLAVATGQNTGDGTDTLSGFENLTGSPQNDTLEGNSVDNVLNGGAGIDTASFANAGAPITANLATGAASGAGSDTLNAFEHVTGSAHDDTLTGTDGDNTITGGSGNDTVSYAAAPAAVSVDLAKATAPQATGGGGNDTLVTIESVIASAGNDTIAGTAGDNVLDGGAGVDTLSYASASVGVVVNLGTTTAQDTVGAGTDTLSNFENVDGSPGDDGLTGNSGANVLNGGDGDDYLDGAGGNDTENGGAGNDRFFQGTASNGGDALNGGDGTDLADYSQRSGLVTITRDGVANDGAPGEGDDVAADVEDQNIPSVEPGAPRNVAATAGNRSATVTWAAPASDGGRPITGYRVTASPGGATASTAGDQRSAVVGNLTNGTSYTFTVVATNDRGTGPASAASNAVVPKAADGTTGTQGYTMVDAGGAVYNFGATAKFFGSMAGHALNAPIIGLAHTPTGKGYWLVARDGGIFSFGDARFFGSMGGIGLNAPVLGMEPTPSGNGYWLFAGDGGIFSFGDATFFGSMGGKPLNQPVVGMSSTSTGKGYWLVASDGGIFSFGDARFFGSMGGKPLNQPVFDIAGGAGDNGYYLVARDGGVFAFGNIEFYGSAAPSGPSIVVGIGATPTGKGYWIADDRGMVFRFGDAEPLGDLGTSVKATPITGFAAVPKLR
ncbi:MAG: fibronectin type III domain-containing protein [Actinobacteria bacterium]|nr:fibronectin type III domain-containing protein [Actinomycetota bacterium]